MQHLHPSRSNSPLPDGPTSREILGFFVFCLLLLVPFGGGMVAGAMHALESESESASNSVKLAPAPVAVHVPSIPVNVVPLAEDGVSDSMVSVWVEPGQSDLDDGTGQSVNLW